jgi:hypothetical protein
MCETGNKSLKPLALTFFTSGIWDTVAAASSLNLSGLNGIVKIAVNY